MAQIGMIMGIVATILYILGGIAYGLLVMLGVVAGFAGA